MYDWGWACSGRGDMASGDVCSPDIGGGDPRTTDLKAPGERYPFFFWWWGGM